MRKLVLLSAAALVLGAVSAYAADPAMTGTTSKGPALTDSKGMTLYTWDKDSAGKSTCNGTCATNWPPLVAPADAKPSGNWTVVKRDDGSSIWAYKGMPLYTWAKDKAPGDVTGDGVANTWHIAKP